METKPLIVFSRKAVQNIFESTNARTKTPDPKNFFKFKQSFIMHHIVGWDSRHCLYKSSPTNKVKVKYTKFCVVKY